MISFHIDYNSRDRFVYYKSMWYLIYRPERSSWIIYVARYDAPDRWGPFIEISRLAILAVTGCSEEEIGDACDYLIKNNLSSTCIQKEDR